MLQSDIEELRGDYARQLEQVHPQGVDLSQATMTALSVVPRHQLLEGFYAYDWAVGSMESVLNAYTRHDLVRSDPEVLRLIYSDATLVTELDDAGNPISSTSQPSLVALMLELALLAPGQRVLEIGAGTGYNAALISEVIGSQQNVVSVDNQRHVVDRTRRLLGESGYGNISVVCCDASQPMKFEPEFDRIIVTAGCADLPWHWVRYLRPDGLMLVPLQHGGPGAHPLVRLRPVNEAHMTGSVVGWSAFMALKGTATDCWPNEIPSQSEEPSRRYPPRWPANMSAESAFLDFHYYLSLVDRRTALWGNLNFVDHGHLILRSDPEAVEVWGGDAPYRDLTAAIEAWRRLEEPPLVSWLTELYRKEAWESETTTETDEWMIDRGRTLQKVAPAVRHT